VLVPESIPVLAGSPVAFTVKSDTYDRFEIPGYGVSMPVAPGQPATLAFDAVRTGHYPLQLASNGAVLGGLEVVTR
jgi:heme/copper-type cytochrome/quinol oxidase subunit 2